MSSIKRKMKILEMLKSEDFVRISDLTEIFNVSKVTVREDLDDLEHKGLLIRTRGGAMNTENMPAIQMLSQQLHEGQAEKKAICAAALQLIVPRMNIIIDSGSTMVHLARFVTGMNVTVITNSYLILQELKDSPNVQVFVAGGMLVRPYLSLIDTTTSFMFEQIHADILFMGAPGFSVNNNNITTRITMDAEIKKQMIKSSSTVCLLADSSKQDKMFIAKICEWDLINYLITDAMSDVDRQTLEARGVKVIIAQL